MIRIINGKDTVSDFPSWYSYLGHSSYETMLLSLDHQKKSYYVIGFQQHLERLYSSCSRFNLLNPRQEDITNTISNCIIAQNLTAENYVIRVIAFPNDWVFYCDNWVPTKDLKNGISTSVVHIERNLPQFKTGSSIASVQANISANAQDCEEALLLDDEGIIREGAWCNFFWINKTGEICTPKNNLLPGITRQLVLSRFPSIKVEDHPWSAIKNDISEAFITQSTHGVVPINRIDEQALAIGEATMKIQAFYQDIHSLSSDWIAYF